MRKVFNFLINTSAFKPGIEISLHNGVLKGRGTWPTVYLNNVVTSACSDDKGEVRNWVSL